MIAFQDLALHFRFQVMDDDISASSESDAPIRRPLCSTDTRIPEWTFAPGTTGKECAGCRARHSLDTRLSDRGYTGRPPVCVRE